MAKIITRVWTSRGPTGKKIRHVSYGDDVRIDGRRERTVSTEWTTETQAHEALTDRLKDAEHGKVSKPADATLGALVRRISNTRPRSTSGRCARIAAS
jgi:hypothetical protein